MLPQHGAGQLSEAWGRKLGAIQQKVTQNLTLRKKVDRNQARRSLDPEKSRSLSLLLASIAFGACRTSCVLSGISK